mgnify:CR=1 FL=1
MKTNQFRAMMLVLLMAVVSLGMVNAQAITGCKGCNSSCWLFGTDKGYYERYSNEYEWPVHDTG